MKFLLLGLLVLAGAVALSLGIVEEPGYIMLGYGNWSAETTLAFFLVVLLVLFVVLYYSLRTLSGLRRLPRRSREWHSRRLTRKARISLNQGLVALAEGNWSDAEKKLIRHAGVDDNAMLNYIAAARAAQQQGAHERRDQYLRRAHQAMPEADVAVGLTQAELQISHNQMEQALATLTHLRSLAPKHVHVLHMLMELYRGLGDWNHLHELLPELRKRDVITEQHADELEAQSTGELMKQAAAEHDLDRVQGLWNHLPKRLARDSKLLLMYSGFLQTLGAGSEAEALVRQSLRREWNDKLVYFFGHLHGGDAARQLSQAEEWLPEHERDPVLLLTLGRLAIRNRLWGKARSFLEASLGIAPTLETYQLLGSLLEKMGESDKAMGCYRQGMLMAADSNSMMLPAPEPAVAEPDEPAKPDAGDADESGSDVAAGEGKAGASQG